MEIEGVSLRAAPALVVATRKGLFFLQADDAARQRWQLEGPAFLGHIVNHAVMDPRDPSRIVASSRTGHLGPTIFRSIDGGRTFQEARRPPAFRKAKPGERAQVVSHTFWLSPGHARQPGVWFAGTSPQALWRSDDDGDTWEGVSGFNDHPDYALRTEDPQAGTPDGPVLHSVLIDPRDPEHLYLGLSGGGVWESTDGGADWQPLNQGLACVGADPDGALVAPGSLEWREVGPQHDPHLVQMHPANPDLLYQQNHCGIYRLERPERRWQRVGLNMPEEIGDIGFVIGLHPRDTKRCWVFPMDGTDVWPRTCPGGRPAVYSTGDGGASWQRQARGLPPRGWWTVKRQSMAVDDFDPAGVFFGTTSGEVWGSIDEGESWRPLAQHLPEIYALEAALPA